jgi:hypothetical protein
MARKPLEELFAIRPVPRKQKSGRAPGLSGEAKRRAGIHSCPPDRICIYVMGPVSGKSKVGVSRAPYKRMMEHERAKAQELMMCYFAEVPRTDGFAVEAAFLNLCKSKGFNPEAEWVDYPREAITADLRRIMRAMGVTPSVEVGDTGERSSGRRTSDIGSHFQTGAFLAGVTPVKRG